MRYRVAMRKRDWPVDDIRRFLEPGPIVLVSSAWIVVLQGWETQYVIAPVILYFVIGAVAANALEATVTVPSEK